MRPSFTTLWCKGVSDKEMQLLGWGSSSKESVGIVLSTCDISGVDVEACHAACIAEFGESQR